MRLHRLVIAAAVGLWPLHVAAQDHGGPVPLEVEWTPQVETPRFPSADGPRVSVDAAHGNWHTLDFRFKSFGDLAAADGYRLTSSGDAISADVLAASDIFVISNAVLGGEDSEWVLPTPPALTDDEVDALVAWVEEGGALLLIADHMPFPASVEALASKLGLVFYNGYAKSAADKSGTAVFTKGNGSLADIPITKEIESVITYTGQGFRVIGQHQPVFFLPEDWRVFLPSNAFVPFDETTPNVSTRGLLQGALLRHGQGRVAVFGEAAMFTAQRIGLPDGRERRVGLNDPQAEDNAAFVLNVLAWLAGEMD